MDSRNSSTVFFVALRKISKMVKLSPKRKEALNKQRPLLDKTYSVRTEPFRESFEALTKHRKLILKTLLPANIPLFYLTSCHVVNSEYPNILGEIYGMRICARAFAHGRGKEFKVEGKFWPCNRHLCPSCEQWRHERHVYRTLKFLSDCDPQKLGMLVVKSPPWTLGSLPYFEDAGLWGGIRKTKEDFRWLMDKCCGLSRRRGPFKKVVWTIETSLDGHRGLWVPHVMAIVAGCPSSSQLQALRERWAERSGRNDNFAVHYAPLRENLLNAATYIDKQLAGAFVPRHLLRQGENRRVAAIRIAVKKRYRASLDEYLHAVSHSGRMFSTFGGTRRRRLLQDSISLNNTTASPPAPPLQSSVLGKTSHGTGNKKLSTRKGSSHEIGRAQTRIR